MTDKVEIYILELNKIRGKEKEELQEAEKKLNRMSEDEEMQRLAWWREKVLHDEASLKGMGRREEIRNSKREGRNR